MWHSQNSPHRTIFPSCTHIRMQQMCYFKKCLQFLFPQYRDEYDMSSEIDMRSKKHQIIQMTKSPNIIAQNEHNARRCRGWRYPIPRHRGWNRRATPRHFTLMPPLIPGMFMRLSRATNTKALRRCPLLKGEYMPKKRLMITACPSVKRDLPCRCALHSRQKPRLCLTKKAVMDAL